MISRLLSLRSGLALLAAGLALVIVSIAIAARNVEQARSVLFALAVLAGVTFVLLVVLLVERRRRAPGGPFAASHATRTPGPRLIPAERWNGSAERVSRR